MDGGKNELGIIYIFQLKIEKLNNRHNSNMLPLSLEHLFFAVSSKTKWEKKKNALSRNLIKVIFRVQLLVGHNMPFYAHNHIKGIATHYLIAYNDF